MQFLTRIRASVQETFRTREQNRSARTRRSPSSALETLEDRSLLSVPGVTVAYGNLTIQAPSGSHGNVATVSIDPSNHDVKVWFNGQSEEFSPSSVCNITYMGGSGGGDKFTNKTSLVRARLRLWHGQQLHGQHRLQLRLFLR